MKQIRNLAISGVNTLEKANKVCEIVGDARIDLEEYWKSIETEWLMDMGQDVCFMAFSSTQEDHNNFKNCTQMTYEEFLDKHDKPKDDLVTDKDRAARREMEKDSEDVNNMDGYIDRHQAGVYDVPKTTKEQYELEPSKWVVYYTREKMKGEWCKRPSSHKQFETFNTYKLILKEHEHIADAIIANPDVEVEYKWKINNDANWMDTDTEMFFNIYNSKEYAI